MIEFIAITGVLDALNPLTHFSAADYASIWARMYNNFLSGIWARIFATAFLIGAFWFGVYRRLVALGILLFVMAIVITYMGGVVAAMFWWAN
ncbi:MAG: hypothetical protein WCJ37_02075 [Syntrophus sp. (in: bacteria)]